MVTTLNLSVFCIAETWLDADSAVLGRCRCAGNTVVDQPRPRLRDDLSVNHGGVAIMAVPGVSLEPLPTGCLPSTFEVVACHATIHRSRVAVVTVYRPGSQPVTAGFFDELVELFERLAVLSSPTYVAGDFNVHLDRPDNLHAARLQSIFSAFGFIISTTGPTHQSGGTLDLVASRLSTSVSVIDAGDFIDSDHSLLRWSVIASPPSAPVHSAVRWPWHRLDLDQFRSELQTSVLCQLHLWPADVNIVAQLFDDVITDLLDHILPTISVVHHPRPSDP